VLEALDRALKRAELTPFHLDGLIASPSLAEPRFMEVGIKTAVKFGSNGAVDITLRRTTWQLLPTFSVAIEVLDFVLSASMSYT
jgi:hypothetical protein